MKRLWRRREPVVELPRGRELVPQMPRRPERRVSSVMKKVIVESPYGAPDEQTVQRNRQYARHACHDCIRRGENPFASHLFYTQFLDDSDPAERVMGIEMGFARWDDAEVIVFYLDHGLTQGMQKALLRAFAMGLPIERRFIRQQLSAPPVAPGLSIEEALKNMITENNAKGSENAEDRDTRADGSQDSKPERVG